MASDKTTDPRDAEIARLRAQLAAAQADNAALRKQLEQAREMVELWASYADSYYKEKHGLADDLAEINAALANPAPGAPLLDAVRELVEAGVSVVGDLETERDECESPGTRQSLDATISYLSSRLAAVRAVLPEVP